MSLADTLRRFLNIRQPTDEDLHMAALEMDLFLRKEGYVPQSWIKKRRFRIKRKRKDEGGVKTVGTVKVINGKKD